MRASSLWAAAMLTFSAPAVAQPAAPAAEPPETPSIPGVPSRSAFRAGLTAVRPIAGLDTVFIEEMTWMEVRDALRSGTKTVVIGSGGVEANGPYLATGKHNYVLRATTEAIARKLGHTLVAPIIPFVPEGKIDPPSGMMNYSGSISVTEETFQRLVTDIAASMKTHGFEHIILIADSGGNVDGMKAVAKALSARWGGKPTIHYIAEYYDYPGVRKWIESQGIHETAEGIHDEYSIASVMMLVDPMYVRMPQRVAAGKFSINGVSLAPLDTTLAMARRIVDYRATVTVDAYHKLIGETK
ncbi:MAG: hypothetical protein JWM88_1041 [Verrucomicrobia bacterium]|nr:hypothetical protein [Verrucomicrobiota bacterium]